MINSYINTKKFEEITEATHFVNLLLRDLQSTVDIRNCLVSMGMPSEWLVQIENPSGDAVVLEVHAQGIRALKVDLSGRREHDYNKCQSNDTNQDPMSFTPFVDKLGGRIAINQGKVKQYAEDYEIPDKDLFHILAVHEMTHFLMMGLFGKQKKPDDWISEATRDLHEAMALAVVDQLLGKNEIMNKSVNRYLEGIKADTEKINSKQAKAYSYFFKVRDCLERSPEVFWKFISETRGNCFPKLA